LRFYLENYGCTLNQAQGEMIANSLISQGNQIVENLDDADSVLVSTCVVIKHTEDKMKKRILEFRESGKNVIVSGCLTDPSIEGVRRIDFSHSKGYLPIIKTDDLSAGIPIAEGCNGGCTFCISRIARGRLRSYSEQEILRTAKGAIDHGARELRITALDTASYGHDNGRTLPQLISALASLDGEFRLRIGMMEPENASEIMDDLIHAMKSAKVYKFLHLPFQSGDDQVLRKMGRKYRVEEFKNIVKKFRESFPSGMLSTDIIVGFPNETVSGLRASLETIRETRPEILNITKYSARPGTAAYGWKTPSTNQTSQWSQIFHEAHKEISEESMKRFLGQEIEVTLLEKGKEGTLIGRDSNYHPVVVRKGMIGESKKVKIISYTPFYLVGR
jgi:MiaB-like tRNA modifying enzyme